MTLDASYLEYMLRASGGKEVRYGSEKTWGHLETVTEQVFDGEVAVLHGDRQTVVVQTGKITAAVGVIISVDGTEYVVRDKATEEEGGLTRFFLADKE